MLQISAGNKPMTSVQKIGQPSDATGKSQSGGQWQCLDQTD
jgi:hypothetical protein